MKNNRPNTLVSSEARPGCFSPRHGLFSFEKTCLESHPIVASATGGKATRSLQDGWLIAPTRDPLMAKPNPPVRVILTSGFLAHFCTQLHLAEDGFTLPACQCFQTEQPQPPALL